MMKKIANIPQIDDFENYLFIGPHPDDIEVGAGATVARLVAMGKKVSYVIATDGRYGSEDPEVDCEELVKLRQKESLEAAKILGVEDVTFLPFHDGGLYDQAELTKALAIEIAKRKPDMVFCPDPLLHTECHADHLIVGRAASSAYIMSLNVPTMRDLGVNQVMVPKALAYYYTARPNRYFALKGYQKKQFEALKAFKSQFTYTEDGKGSLNMLFIYLKIRALHFGIPRFKGKADGFRVNSPLMIHCCAEKI
ncbi:MAG: PIG-L family deacetylase [Clostridiales bacterium]|jgi:LmbE family N-acetylglucosaminyl deacetylase|nr:PIG-L family deacetylase [Clostridiales bacterium]HOK81997.1 PIG-L family deacetylase [Clostridia bacterium]HOL61432.1 PIG-L family deacetylase [Clostridia bacterium]HPO53708.1 PIG-L family deacetylase [Clostridia bacterium]